MKLKLAALLFSQAAVNAVAINRGNYRENLCNDSLFAPRKIENTDFNIVSILTEEYESRKLLSKDIDAPSTLISNYEDEQSWDIKARHQIYCKLKENYQKTIEEKKKGISRQANFYVDIAGVKLANICQDLRNAKESSPENSWDYIAPKLKCS